MLVIERVNQSIENLQNFQNIFAEIATFLQNVSVSQEVAEQVSIFNIYTVMKSLAYII